MDSYIKFFRIQKLSHTLLFIRYVTLRGIDVVSCFKDFISSCLPFPWHFELFTCFSVRGLNTEYKTTISAVVELIVVRRKLLLFPET